MKSTAISTRDPASTVAAPTPVRQPSRPARDVARAWKPWYPQRRMNWPAGTIFCVMLVAQLLCAPFACAQTNAWPQWRGVNHEGISLERNWLKPWPASGPKQLWKRNVGIGFSSVSVSAGRVFTMGNTSTNVDTVFCLDATTGRIIWTNSYPCALDPRYYEGGPGATPTIDGDRVFTFSKKGHVLCIDAASGKTIWSRNIADELSLKLPEWSFAGSALVEDDLVILNAGSAGTALDKKTGRIVWSSSPEPGGYATPVPFEMNGQRAIAIFSAKALVAADRALAGSCGNSRGKRAAT